MDARGDDTVHPFVRGLSLREVCLLLSAFVTAFVLVPLLVEVDAGSYFAAMAVALGLTVLIVAGRWDRWPAIARILPPVLAIVVVALLRDAGGTGTTGLVSLMLLAVVWVALHDDRRALIATITAMGVALIAPILLVGAPVYPSIEARRAVVLLLIAAGMGVTIQRLVARVRNRAEEAARGREFVLAIMNSAGEGIVSIDAAGRAEYANPAACAMLGYEPDELRGKPFHDTVHHTRADGSRFPHEECPMHQTMATGVEQEAGDELFWRADGTSFHVSFKSSAINNRPDSGVVLTFADISERRRIEEMKDELVSVVSHELRTPLTSIRGSLGLIAGGAVGQIPPEADRMIGIAVTNTDRLVRLINEILDIERIESGRVEMSRRLCDSEDLMLHAAETMATQAEEGGTRIEVEPCSVPLWVDPDRIMQTLMNLLSNAIKFSYPGDPVRLRATRDNGEVRFEVIDKGRGIPADQIERVFERFGQVDATDARVKGGTGLGLPIARSIVHQHGGRMWAESEPGEGTTMAFTLPTVASNPAASEEDGHDGLLALVIEDDTDLAQVLKKQLESEEMQVWVASGAAEAVQMLGTRRPDLITLDLSLPDANGSELVRWMRGQPELVDVPLAIYTVHDLTDADRQQLQLGPSLHATKTITSTEEFTRAAKQLIGEDQRTLVAAEPVA